MRDYYEPKLLNRLLSGERLPPINTIQKLNRLQPLVRIIQISPENSSDRVSVDVEVQQVAARTSNAAAAVSGASRLQLFRDGKLVATALEGADALSRPSDLRRVVHFNGVRLPHSGAHSFNFTAYAFNTDRVKSLTAEQLYSPAAPLPRQRGRAWIIDMGVNEAGSPALSLRYAANDARIMAATVEPRLKALGVFDRVIHVPLISDSTNPNGASKVLLKAVLEKLAGKPVDPVAFPETARIERASPDDLVLFSYSGHGYADGSGQFFLIPSDAARSGNTSSLREILRGGISSLELSNWLRDVDAGELVIIIDACQSAASVDTPEFRPGPMASRGLGQLAWDKGARVLTATQANNVAIESRRIEQGLLTYALTRDALESGRADRNPQDGRITLSEWLTYGMDRVPVLQDLIHHSPGGLFDEQKQDRLLVLGEGLSSRLPPSQEPALFDFSVTGEGPVICSLPNDRAESESKK